MPKPALSKREASIDDFLSHRVTVNGKEFEVAGKRWLAGCYSDSSYEIFPGIWQHTREYANFKIDLYNELQSVPTVFDEENGWLYSGAGQVLVDWGARASHVLPPMEDNSQLRKDMDLREADAEEEELIRCLFRFIFSHGKATALRIKDISNSGFPYMQPGREFKSALARRVYANADEFIHLTATHNWERRLSLFDSYPAYTNGIRVQADTVKEVVEGVPKTKQRYSYSVSDMRRGEMSESSRFPIDMSVWINGELEPRLVAARVRSIYALTYDDNCILQAINGFIAEGIKCLEAANYKGEVEESRRVKEYLQGGSGYVTAMDKSQFGETFSPRLLEIWLEVLGEFFHEEVVEFVRVSIDAVTFFRSPKKGQKTVEATRDLVSKDRRMSLKGSFKSGNALVAVLGKCAGAADLMLIVRRAFRNNFTLDKFIENRIEQCFLSTFSDDNKAHFRLLSCKKAFDEAVASGASLHKDEVQSAGDYLGWIYYPNGDYGVNMSRFLESITGTERSYKSKTYHADGIKAKIQRYSSNPLFNDIFDIVNRKYREHFDLDLLSYCQRAVLQGISVDDQIFLDEPDKIFYYPNLSPSPELVDLEFASIPLDEVSSLLDKLLL